MKLVAVLCLVFCLVCIIVGEESFSDAPLRECNDREKAMKNCPAGKKCMAVIGKRRRSRLICVTQGKSGDQPE